MQVQKLLKLKSYMCVKTTIKYLLVMIVIIDFFLKKILQLGITYN